MQDPIVDRGRAEELEAYILGAVISSRWQPSESDAWKVLARVCDILEPADFSLSPHRRTWQAIEAQVAEGGPVDPLWVYRRAYRMGYADDALTIVTMEEYEAAMWYTPHVIEMARELRGVALRARLADATAAGDLETAGEHFAQLRTLDQMGRGMIPSMAEIVDRYWEMMDIEQGTPVSWGIPGLDRMTGGMLPGQLIVVGARTGIGKSALAISVAHAMARAGRVAGIVSIEMSDVEMTQRLVSIRTGLPTPDVKSSRTLDAEQHVRVAEALAQIAQSSVRMVEARSALADVVAKARAMCDEQDAELVVIDYLQLIRIGNRNRSRVDELEEITGTLKQLARELGVPIMALAQLNRDSEDHTRPRLSDFRSSGSIEQDADIALLIHLDEDGATATSDRLICHVAKHRNGPTGFINLRRMRATTQVVEEA